MPLYDIAVLFNSRMNTRGENFQIESVLEGGGWRQWEQIGSGLSGADLCCGGARAKVHDAGRKYQHERVASALPWRCVGVGAGVASASSARWLAAAGRGQPVTSSSLWHVTRRSRKAHPRRVASALKFFKVAFSTFWFKFGAALRCQAERSGSEARHKAPNLT